MKFFRRLAKQTLHWIEHRLLAILFATVLLLSAVVVLFSRVVISVPAGFDAVLFRPLSQGVDDKLLLSEGIHLIFPWNKAFIYDSRIQIKKIDLDILTSDQLKSTITISYQYSVNRQTIPLLHKFVGEDYLEKLIIPEVSASTREIFATVPYQQAFTSGLGAALRSVAIDIEKDLMEKMSPGGLDSVKLINVRSIQVEGVTYPVAVQNAIQDKLIQEQQAQALNFQVAAARLEAERKVIEAEGIKKFQDIVNPGLTDNYLKLRGIEATLKLAESNNSKVILFGSPSTGLPLILGGEDGAKPTALRNTTVSVPQPASDAPEAANVKPQGGGK
ncbi:MAG: hypothetical protein CK528_09470 [Alcaligenaceae bacterium]|nr:MAG: hypothetical protein CK528_09470 [Alcaligenaceae bacterium]